MCVILCGFTLKEEFTLIRVPFQVIYAIEACTSGAFTVTCTNTNTCNSVAIKNLVKSVKYLKRPANVYSNIAGNVVHH